MSNTTQVEPAIAAVLSVKSALEAQPSNARLTDKDITAIYTLAYHLVSQGQYELAYRYFSLLTLYRPTRVDCLQGLALTARMLENYDEAINVYSFLAAIDPTEPEHNLAIVECLLMCKKIVEARTLLTLVVQVCQEPSVSDRIRSRAIALSTLINAKGDGPA